ncbi:zinc-ribbon domain-containing protein [Ornithinimicrobium pekingense]
MARMSRNDVAALQQQPIRKREPRPRRGGTRVSDVQRLADLYDPTNELPPHAVPVGSNKRLRWKCSRGPDHLWEAMANSVYRSTSPTSGCPYCAGKRPSLTNRLDVLHPDLAQQWDLEANAGSPTVVAGSERKAWWRCGDGHQWQASIRSRSVLGSGCPRCAAKAQSSRRATPEPGGSLADLHPGIAAEWHATRNGQITPLHVRPQSNKRAWWVCHRGHEWSVPPAGRVGKGGAGCPYCSGRLATPETSLRTLRADIAAEWDADKNGSQTPDDVMPASSAYAWWSCPRGHSYRSRIANRCQLGRACPYCTGQKVGYGNDLATLAPAVAAEWHFDLNGDVTPAQVTTGVQRKYAWLCERGHTWTATIASRVRGGTGCPTCAAGWRRSRPEIQLLLELRHTFPASLTGDTTVNGREQTWSVDMASPELGIIVEYDGAHWHRRTNDRDDRKLRDLTGAGWLVCRARETPLPCRDSDVAVDARRPDVFITACTVTAKLISLIVAIPENSGGAASRAAWGALPEMRRKFDLYRAGGVARETAAAQVIWSELVVGRRSPREPSITPPRPRPGGSLAEKSPAIAAEWHPALNGPFTPADVSNARNAKAWWLCSNCGAVWQAPINGRIRRQHVGCPPCNRKRSRSRTP